VARHVGYAAGTPLQAVRIRWLDDAVADLEAARDYISQTNPQAATEIAERIRGAVRLLADYPAAGRPGRIPNTRELIVTGTPYVLPYRVTGNAVEILRVLHGARKWPET
jgi:toxin ParE1/3/4